MLRMHSIQPTWWDVEQVIQSDPVSCVDIWFIDMRHNLLGLGGSIAYKLILYTGIRNLSGGEFRISLLSIPRIVVHGRCYYSLFIYLIIYLFFWFFCVCFLLCCFFFFLTSKTIYAVREHWFAILILVKI